MMLVSSHSTFYVNKYITDSHFGHIFIRVSKPSVGFGYKRFLNNPQTVDFNVRSGERQATNENEKDDFEWLIKVGYWILK